MFTVLECVVIQHDNSIVALAATVALVGMLALFHLLLRAEESAASRRRNWIAIASFSAGLSVWATHFLAMLAYRGVVPIGFDIAFTTLSAMVAVVGFWIALAMVGKGWIGALTRSCIVTVTIAAMHFIGMAGMNVAATIAYDIGPIVVGSVV